jgi:NAD-dependent DNA ligase
VDAEKQALFSVDSLGAFDIEGVSTKNALKLAEAGLTDLVSMYEASQTELVAIVGNALGAKLYHQLHTKIAAASPERWISAYQGWPRGFGKQRIAALLELGPVEDWPTLKSPPRGMGVDSFKSTIGCVPEFLEWRGRLGYSAQLSNRVELGNSAQPNNQVKTVVAETVKATSIVKTNKPQKGGVCMTGFRDAALEERLKAAGWVIHDSVKKDTSVLIVADAGKMGSTKVAAAQAKGVRIILRADVSQLK